MCACVCAGECARADECVCLCVRAGQCVWASHHEGIRGADAVQNGVDLYHQGTLLVPPDAKGEG
eukprot:3391775-Prorocentrum_lima.AAC.1